MHRTLSTLLLAALAACGNRPPAGSLRIALEVTDGSHAGRYRAAAAGSACNRPDPESPAVQVRFTDPDSGAALSSLQLIVSPDGDFYLGVLFGGFRRDGRRHEIETRTGRPRLGEGSARVIQSDATTLIEIHGRTGDGVLLTARIRCSHTASVAGPGA